MKKLRIGLLAIALFSLVASSSASAAMMGMIRPSLVGGINDMTTSGGALGFTGGLDLGIGLMPALDLTVGGEFLSRAFSAGNNVNYIHIPAIIHIHLAPMFSIGGGGFYDVALTSGATVNYGITGALRIKLGMTPLYVEGRYNYGLDTTDWGTNTSEFQALLGIRF